MNEKLTRFKNLALASGVVFVLLYGLFGVDSCKMKSNPVKQESSIDSVKIRRYELVKKFDCDTSVLFDSDEFTIKKTEILSKLSKLRIVKIDLLDVAQKNDSIYILTADCWDEPFSFNKCIFEIKKSDISKLPENECVVFCIIKNLKLIKTQFAEITKDDEAVLYAECIYFEEITNKPKP